MPAGRPQGASNKSKNGLKARLREQYGDKFDVIMLMGKNCLALQEMADACQERLQETLEDKEADIEDVLDHKSGVISSAKVAIDALDKLAQYVEPKLKSIEISGDPENPLEIAAYELTATERSARIAALLESARERRDGAVDNDERSDMESSGGPAD
jgi:hypothetical protein